MLPIQLLPWSGLIPGALILAWKRRDRADRFFLVWSLFIVLFFSISTEKRDLYVLPAYPAFFLMAARFIRPIVAPEPPAVRALPGRRWFVIPQACVVAECACRSRSWEPEPWRPTWC
jgi:4-amino-4-deoxy-L-arabinose transferase-like glycosyltransferase